jgi:hypothetical protein
VKGWEVIGIEPDVKISRREALDAAKKTGRITALKAIIVVSIKSRCGRPRSFAVSKTLDIFLNGS